ncbi:MAG: hypothetical protein JWM27_3805 [Gemmatimonadetes bacterium]|nr:hypothetical protein [Gemmatimonadota bacterium]
MSDDGGGLLNWLLGLIGLGKPKQSPAPPRTPEAGTSSPPAPTPPSAAAPTPAAAPAPAAAAAPAPPTPTVRTQTMASSNVVANPGWEEDIFGMLNPFVEQMMWRLNLGVYEDVRANANLILSRIQPGGGMPPPPYPPLSDDAIQTYTNWVNNDCPLNRPPAQTSTAAAATGGTTTAPATTILAGNQQPRPIKFP